MEHPGAAQDIALESPDTVPLGLRQPCYIRRGLGEPRRLVGNMRVVAGASVRNHGLQLLRHRSGKLRQGIAVSLTRLVVLAELFEQAGLEQQRHHAERVEPERAGDGLERGRQITRGTAHRRELEPAFGAVGIARERLFEQPAGRAGVAAAGGAVGLGFERRGVG
jgi:hypothetical protein